MARHGLGLRYAYVSLVRISGWFSPTENGGDQTHARNRHTGTAYDLHLAASEPAPHVEGWPAGLRLAVDNLLNNAALHGRRPHVQVHVSLTWDTGSAHITVSDNGPGIPAEQREAVKARFARGPHPHSHGSGLGLALVQQQAELHGGALALADAPGGGLMGTLSVQSGRTGP